jgi:uncharacterized protein VirK/YbjX
MDSMHDLPTPDVAPPWPDAHAALGEEYAAQWTRRAKYALRKLVTSRQRAEVMAFVAGSHAARTLLACAPRVFYPVMRKHLDRRFDTDRRARAVIESIRGLERGLSRAACDTVCRGGSVVLGTLPDGTRIRLNLNRLTFDEGLWALDLSDEADERLFTISFGFSEPGTLMIGCVQGPHRHVDGLQSGRDLTKAAEGLRPAHLLMHLLRDCAAAWGVARIVGVDEPFQSKGRWNHPAVGRKFDYDTFWTEVGGTKREDGNWDLPVSVPQRPLEDVPAKRRSMYRKRYALLAALGAEARAAMGAHAGG